MREQTRRHARIAQLLGITTLVLAVNKMDLVEFDRAVFDEICREFAAIQGDARVHAIPLSALNGDNVITRERSHALVRGARACSSTSKRWKSIAIPPARPLRFPVQLVVRPSDDFRGYAGQIGSGVVHVGDTVTVWPANRSSRVKRIVTWDGDIDRAFAPMSVTLTLEDELDISRGDVLAAGPTEVGRPLRRRHRLDGRTAARSPARLPVEARLDDRVGGDRPRVLAERDRDRRPCRPRGRWSSTAIRPTAPPAASS